MKILIQAAKILDPSSPFHKKVKNVLLQNGRITEIGDKNYQSDKVFKAEGMMLTPGWFDITKLDSMLEELPPEWNSLQKSLTELSLIALKRFDYDKGTGSLYFLNREGSMKLHFAGDYGTRALNLQVHDERNTNDTTAAKKEVTAQSPALAPLPEASARPARPDLAESDRDR